MILNGKTYVLTEIRKHRDIDFEPTLMFSTVLEDGSIYVFEKSYPLSSVGEILDFPMELLEEDLLDELFFKIFGINIEYIRNGTETNNMKEYLEIFGPSDLDAEVQEQHMDLIESVMKNV